MAEVQAVALEDVPARGVGPCTDLDSGIYLRQQAVAQLELEVPEITVVKHQIGSVPARPADQNSVPYRPVTGLLSVHHLPARETSTVEDPR